MDKYYIILLLIVNVGITQLLQLFIYFTFGYQITIQFWPRKTLKDPDALK